MRDKELLEILFSKDTKETYEKFKKLEIICNESDELYTYFDRYMEALSSNNSCVRARGFKLILRNAKWDKDNKINNNIKEGKLYNKLPHLKKRDTSEKFR